MRIQRLTVENFKSFDRLDLELGDFNVFIGANASGKSNVLHVLEFLRDIAASGLRNAVSMQGDVEFLRNVKVGVTSDTFLGVSFGVEHDAKMRPDEESGRTTGYELQAVDYSFALSYWKKTFGIARNEAKIYANYLTEVEGGERKVEEGGYWIVGDGDTAKLEFMYKGEPLGAHVPPDLVESAIPVSLLMSKETLLESEYFGYPYYPIQGYFEGLSIYDFDTRAQRKAAPITGKSELEEDGSNVALVLKNLLENEEKRRRFTNLIQYVLPFVSDVDVERFAGRSLIATLEETHAPGTHLPASLLSEGTIKVISLLIALYFEEKPVIAFEEPASNLHPELISRVVEMMKEQSAEKQIFVTTHSPEVIKHVGLENVYLVSRDENGFSTVTKPAEKEEVRIFLENKMGIDDLFVQGLLEI